MSKKDIENYLYKDCNIDIDLSEFDSWDELSDYVESNSLLTEDIIYYYNAIEYLKENDPSLHESLEIASEFGYEVSSLNSELLASLLKSQNNRNEFYKYESEITEYYEEIENVIDEIQAKIEDIQEIIEFYEDTENESKIEQGENFIEILEIKIEDIKNQ